MFETELIFTNLMINGGSFLMKLDLKQQGHFYLLLQTRPLYEQTPLKFCEKSE